MKEISNVPSLNLNEADSITYEEELSGAYCVKSRFIHMMSLLCWMFVRRRPMCVILRGPPVKPKN
jgi:hypothetical protein